MVRLGSRFHCPFVSGRYIAGGSAGRLGARILSTATYLSERVVRSDEPDAQFLSDRWRREVSDRTDVTRREGIVLTGARTNPVSGMNLPASVVIASNPQFNQGSFDLLISSVDVPGETDLKLALQTSWDDVVNSALANFAVTIDS